MSHIIYDHRNKIISPIEENIKHKLKHDAACAKDCLQKPYQILLVIKLP